MVAIGYTIMGEQAGPEQLVRDAVRAEEAGFDFLAASDHFEPWLAEQGHAPYTWSVLGAVAQATEQVELMTYVTCPTMRYHPAVVAQKAATVQLLSGGRFTLCLGSGENLNEHVVGRGWPAVDVRLDMLAEALQVITRLFAGETVTFRGTHIQAHRAKLWDLPSTPPPIGVAVSGPSGIEVAGEHADAMVAVQPDADLVAAFDAAGGQDKPKIGQTAVSYDVDEQAAVKRAVEQFRWFAGGWDVMAELPGPDGFAAASEQVGEDDISAQIPCGPDVGAQVEAVKRFVDAGFTQVALVQVGGEHQDQFLDMAEAELLPELRRL